MHPIYLILDIPLDLDIRKFKMVIWPFFVASGRAAGCKSPDIIKPMFTSFGSITITFMLELNKLISGSGAALGAY